MTNLQKVQPTFDLIASHNSVQAWDLFNNFEENMACIQNGTAVHAVTTRVSSVLNEGVIAFFAAYIVNNYVCNVGDTFRVPTEDDCEFTLFIKEDGVYVLINNEDAHRFDYYERVKFDKEVWF